MKQLVKVEEIENEGLISLLGQRVTLFCMNYIYEGNLVGVNDTYVKLENSSIVYETGSLEAKQRKDAQRLPNSWYIRLSALESFGVLNG